MSKKNIQLKKKEMLAKLFSEKPEVLAAKKFTGAILLVWLVIQIIELGTEYYCVAQGLIAFSPVNIIVVLAMMFLLWTIYQGVRKLAYLPALGSIFMIIRTFTKHIYSLMSAQYDMPVRIYAAVFIFAAYSQLIILFYLLSNEKTTLYFDEVKKIILKLIPASGNKHNSKK